MIVIDGNTGEGGGQILRVALALSAIFKKSIKVTNIRAGRKNPGLAAQHLTGVHLCRELCNAKVVGAEKGSTELEFHPGHSLQSGSFTADIKTAGSVSLLVQAALPIAVFSPDQVELQLKGGTNAEMAPQIDFTTEVFRPNLEKFGVTFDFQLLKRGYFPKGGGHCIITINNSVDQLNSVDLTELGSVRDCYGWSFVAGNVPLSVSNDVGREIEKLISQSSIMDKNLRPNIECYKEDPSVAKNNCSGAILCCETDKRCYIGGSALGNRQDSSKQTAAKAFSTIQEAVSIGSCVDTHVQDQLIIFMALAKGTSRIRTGPLTLHTKTAIEICELMIPVKFKIVPDGKTFIIECEGVGFKK